MRNFLISYATFWNDVYIGKDIDFDLIEEYLSEDVKYTSQLVYEELVGKDKIKEYLTKKAQAIIEEGSYIITDIAKVNEEDCILLYQNNPNQLEGMVFFEYENEKVTSINLAKSIFYNDTEKEYLYPNSYISSSVKRIIDMNLGDSISQRQIILEDFKIDLPIKGGWGYTKEDAVVIDKFDSTAKEKSPFNGVNYEYTFVEKRIYEELMVCRPVGNRFADVKWKLEKQSLIDDGDKIYDLLIFTVSGIEDNKTKYYKYKTEYWFDITSFYDNSTRFFMNDIHSLQIESLEELKKMIKSKDVYRKMSKDRCFQLKFEKKVNEWMVYITTKDEYIGDKLQPFQILDENLKIFNDGLIVLGNNFINYLKTDKFEEGASAFKPFVSLSIIGTIYSLIKKRGLKLGK